ncbi:MAG TPA: PAS domain S-box protein [Methanotrichaceae archaeon]|nr:PAS domain S-box protein [Methanotrichaceae archaeon]
MSAGNPKIPAEEEQPKSYQELQRENEELKDRLRDAEELTRAISCGEVDALVISGSHEEQVFTLKGADYAYRILVEAMSEGAVTLGQDGLILYCNHHFADMLKSPLEKVLGKSIRSIIEPAHLAAFEALLQQGLGSMEIEIATEDGSYLPAYVSVSSLQLDESQRAWCLVVTDLTYQKKSEEIMAAERLARSIIEQAAEAIIVCDEQGKIIRFSDAASKICGCNPAFKRFEEIFDLRLASVEDAGKFFSPVSASLQGSTLLYVEAKLERDDGRLFYLLLNASPLKNAAGDIIGCVATLADITQLKLMEEELRKARDELEQRILERTIELSQAKEDLEVINEELKVELEHHLKLEVEISQAKQELEASNGELQVELDAHQKLEAQLSKAKQELEVINEELQAELDERRKLETDLIRARDAAEASANAKASFLANMSHELRTPMNAVIGFSSLLLEEDLTTEQMDYIVGIRNGGEAMLALINDILDLSRAERDLVVLEYQPLNLKHCIDESMNLVLHNLNSGKMISEEKSFLGLILLLTICVMEY